MMTYDKALMKQAHDTFKDHLIRKRDDKSGRWLLQRRHKNPDDGWDSWAWMEVVSLEGGNLYIGGDYDFVIFAYYSDKQGDHQAKVRWMGEHTDFSYYVHQKASIGTGHKIIDVYDGDHARATVEEYLADLDEDDEDDQRMAAKIRDVLADDWLSWDDQQSVEEKLYDELGSDWVCDTTNFGMIIAPRLYFAHAALKRLCEIWDGQEEIFGE